MGTDTEMTDPILFLDDDRIVCKMISTILTMSGFHVTQFTDPDECLGTLSCKTHKVLITDYNMPELNGIDFFSKARDVQPDIRGILLTGDFELSAFTKCIQLGFDDCIPKSVAREMLSQSLSESVALFDRWHSREKLLIQHNDGLSN